MKPLQVKILTECPFTNAQLAIMKELVRVSVLPPCKTSRGTFNRVKRMGKLIEQLRDLQVMKKGGMIKPIYKPGGAVFGNQQNSNYISDREFIIPEWMTKTTP